MNPLAAIITKLSTDAPLIALLGGAHVFRAKREAPVRVPSVTVRCGAGSSQNQCGAVTATEARRNSSAMAQIDIWVSSVGDVKPCTGDDADEIQSRVEDILLDPISPVSGTRSWQSMSESQQEGDGLWHNVMRFSFDYGLVIS